MKNKFNCVDMKHKSAEKIYKIISEYNIEEELKFWQERSDKLKDKKRKTLEKHNINT
ncbi:hypothetical protein JXQ31_08070 [candidate division KSB1 bacterium]|nr:hypothetical protein [candidate division KSB1 bacterium]